MKLTFVQKANQSGGNQILLARTECAIQKATQNKKKITYCDIKIKSAAGPPSVTDSPGLPRNNRVKVTIVARPLFMPVALDLYRCEYGEAP
jgi:hypothetical protein